MQGTDKSYDQKNQGLFDSNASSGWDYTIDPCGGDPG